MTHKVFVYNNLFYLVIPSYKYQFHTHSDAINWLCILISFFLFSRYLWILNLSVGNTLYYYGY